MKRSVSLALLLCLVLTLLPGCGSASTTQTVAASNKLSGAYDAAGAVEEVFLEASAVENGLDTGTDLAAPENRKWIITMDLSAETEDLDALLDTLRARLSELGGYIQDQNIHNGSAYSSRRYRSAALTIRVPADVVDDFSATVSTLANLVSSTKNLEDVTLQYSDTESHVAALQAEQQRLLELMEEADTMSDLLEIEARLTEVRYALERYSSQLRLYDDQIDYATVYLDIDEVQEYTPVEEPGLWQRISGGFVDSLEGLGEGLLDLMVWLIVSSPYLLVYGAAAALVWLAVRKALGRRKAKMQKKEKPEETP